MWDAALYDKMAKERSQPSLDLAARLIGRDFERIIDIGCGTGLSTAPLLRYWPRSSITGVDLSAEMLDKAKRMTDKVAWIQRDCGRPLDDLGKFDLVFSNAFLQWLQDQEGFLKNARGLLGDSGALAVQVPDFLNMPASECVRRAAACFNDAFGDIDKDLFKMKSVEGYYDCLKRYYRKAEVWRTGYFHVMQDYEAILDFIRGTALRPYLMRLGPEDSVQFLRKVLDGLREEYEVRNDGNVLFEFKRIFFIAER